MSLLSSLNHYYKTPHYPLQVGTHSFEGVCSLWPPLPGKAICCYCCCWVVSDSLQPHGLQHTRLPWLSLSPAAAAAKSLQSCPTLCDPIDSSPPGSPRPWDSPGKNTGVGCHFLLCTISWSLLNFISIESVMLCNHSILCHPFSFCLQSFPVSGSFPMSWLFASGGQSTGASALASVLPMNIQDWLPFRIDWFDLCCPRDSQEFCPAPPSQKHEFFGNQPSGPALTSVHDYWKNYSLDCMDLCQQNDASAS